MQKINVLNKKTKANQRILLYYICIYLFSHCACPLQFEMRAQFERLLRAPHARHNKLDLSQLNWTANVLNEQIKIM